MSATPTSETRSNEASMRHLRWSATTVALVRHAVAMAGLVAAITLPDGTPVRGRGRREALPPGPLPDFGLYLGKPGSWQPDGPAEWVDWPDFRLPRDPEQAAAGI